jgi:hypothetical protein
MVYKATRDVVHRVLPLIERFATRSLDKVRLLQYLSARAGQEWGVLELVREEASDPISASLDGSSRVLTFRDRLSGAEHQIRYPACLPIELEPLIREEYQRLAIDRPLSTMSPDLFAHFYEVSHCRHCRWRDPAYDQFHRECRFAGKPINFEPVADASVAD